jgi:hypothetical protein
MLVRVAGIMRIGSQARWNQCLCEPSALATEGVKAVGRDDVKMVTGFVATRLFDSAMVEYLGKPSTVRDAGSSGINAREVPHAGYKVVGDKTLRILTVHIVDKGKPFAVPVP